VIVRPHFEANHELVTGIDDTSITHGGCTHPVWVQLFGSRPNAYAHQPLDRLFTRRGPLAAEGHDTSKPTPRGAVDWGIESLVLTVLGPGLGQRLEFCVGESGCFYSLFLTDSQLRHLVEQILRPQAIGCLRQNLRPVFHLQFCSSRSTFAPRNSERPQKELLQGW
jgi:hypothetical protein